MAAITDSVQLLGKGLYQNIPDILTIRAMPTASELDIAGAEDFNEIMLNKILPASVEEKGIDFRQLLEPDYHWLLRALRLLNYGPYYTTNAIYCSKCGTISRGEYRVDLRTVDVKPFPEGFVNSQVVKRDEFIDFNGDIEFRIPTIQQAINCEKDKLFQDEKGRSNAELARICYMISSFKGAKNLTPVELKLKIQQEMSPADYLVLRNIVRELSDFGLRAGGATVCPSCKSSEATFMALADDRFFRPTLGDIRAWRDDRHKGRA